MSKGLMMKKTFLLKGEKFKLKWNKTDVLKIVRVVLHSPAPALKESENSAVILFKSIYMSPFASISCPDLSLCAECIWLITLQCLQFSFKILFDYHTDRQTAFIGI